MTKIQLSIIFPLLLLPLQLSAADTIYGIYSNMQAAGGEFSGFEMFILHNGKPGKCSDSVVLQVAEGVPGKPEMLDCCACSRQRIEFSSSSWGPFVGSIKSDELHGEFTSAKHKVVLKKGLSIWQR